MRLSLLGCRKVQVMKNMTRNILKAENEGEGVIHIDIIDNERETNRNTFDKVI